jgi:hypothetical protein
VLLKSLRVLTLSLFALGSLVRASDTPSTQDCHGSAPASAANGQPSRAVAQTSSTNASAGAKPHLVTLSWNAGVPSHSVPPDPIVGYRIYRSEIQNGGWKPITPGQNVVADTTCIDHDVKAGHTYYYRAQSVSAAGKSSVYSNQATAAVPR